MSSPRSVGGSVREGTRVVLREITASLHNSPPMQPPRRKTGNDSSTVKTAEHEVKVRFAREFADVGSITYSAPESLSSASSFQSLSSTLSTKSSSGICPDSVPPSPNQVANISYVNTSIPGVDDLILACADIHLNSDEDHSFSDLHTSQDLSQDQTFTSATDELVDTTRDISRDLGDITSDISRYLASVTRDSTDLANVTRDISRDLAGEISLDDSLEVIGVLENGSTTRESIKQESKTRESITQESIKQVPITQESTTRKSITRESITQEPITQEPTIQKSITRESIKQEPITQESTTRESFTQDFFTQESITQESITQESITQESTTQEPITQKSTTRESITQVPITQTSLRRESTTPEPITQESTTQESTTQESTCSPLNRTQDVHEQSSLDIVCFSAEELNLHSNLCLSLEKATPDAAKPEESIHLENASVGAPLTPSRVPEIPEILVPPDYVLTENATLPPLPSISALCSLTFDSAVKLSESDVADNANNPSARSSSPINDSNAKILAAGQNVLSPIREFEDKTNSQVETFPPSVCDASNVGEACENLLNDTAASAPKTPEVPGNFEASVTKETESIDAAVKNVEVSPLKVDSLEVNASASSTKEVSTVENNKLDGFLDASTEAIKKEDAVDPVEEDERGKEQSSDEKFDTTLTFQDVSLISETVPEVEQYAEFKPSRQSTTLALPPIAQPNFEELQSAAEQVANDIFKSSLECSEENDIFITATSDLFQDPSSFDYFISHGNAKTINRLRTESLYVKFDPLVGETSMLPQGNIQPINEEQNGKNESSPSPNIETPKRNPAIAAIDRLLFYSPIPSNTIQIKEEPQEKLEQSIEEPKPNTPVINDVNVSKELELVRATVLQLEEELEKQKKEYEAELERQKNSFQEKINKLQAQIAQEVKSKSEITVVVEEYEKSISRLLTERERDRTNFEQEKAKLQEELQTTNVHLTNTEAAFNDVHQKYERLKGVVSAYKSNETVLKEGIQENMETIKGLETRYDQLKNHAMAQLEKANFELDAIRKQHEDETVKLHAMVRKAELKSNSLTELVEQKTKENKELAQILDEVIARVGHQNAE